MGQIWDDPWIAVATARSAPGPTPWNTTLPPPASPPLPAGLTFRCVTWPELTVAECESWLALVGTRWDLSVAGRRLKGAWIPLLVDLSGEPVATCVLRPRGGAENVWLLETLRARSGRASILMRHLMTWVWRRTGPFVLGFTWELSLAELIAAWWRGWMVSASAIEHGWTLIREGDCSFCTGSPVSWKKPRVLQPTLLQFHDAWCIVDDSGLCDTTGYVLAWSGDVPWDSVLTHGDWQKLWMRAVSRPTPKWRATGELIVVGYLNSAGAMPSRWITAEI